MHHLKLVEQKEIMFLLMKLITFTLKCICIIQFNVVTIMLILQDVYDSLKEMKSIIMSMKTLKVAHHININQIILMMQQQIEQLKM